jgi:PAS domain S-box-containing protein
MRFECPAFDCNTGEDNLAPGRDEIRQVDKNNCEYTMRNFNALSTILQENESELMAAILNYALKHGYSKYTSTLVESWRLSITGLTNAISQYIQENENEIPSFSVDSNYREDAIASFGVIEAQRHRSRGIDLGMFLGLFKYYRESYIDIINKKVKDKTKRSLFCKYIIRCFDRFELAFCIEWATASEDKKINELQQNNVHLANEKNKYLTLFESIWNPIILINSSNNIDNINMAGINLLEQSERTGFLYYNDEYSSKLLDEQSTTILNYKGKHILEVFPWLANSLPAFDQYQANFSQFNTTIFHASSQKHQDYCVTIFSMCDVSKKFSGKILVLENITEKNYVEKKLRESEEQYRTLVETMNEGILVLKDDLSVSFVNDKICTLLGCSKEEIVGHTFLDFLHPESKPEFMQQQYSRKSGNAESYEIILINKAGEKVFMLSSPTPLVDQSLSFIGSYEVLTNITNIKLIETQLIHSQKMETIGVMAAGLAHEINTPLQYVIGNSTFIRDILSNVIQSTAAIRELLNRHSTESLNETVSAIAEIINQQDIDYIIQEIPQALKECLEGLDRIASIVLSVKKFAHSDFDSFKSIDVNSEIQNTINVSRNEWKYIANVSTTFDNNLPMLHCITSDFNQAVLNLIINAAHAIDEKYGGTTSKGLINIKTSLKEHDILVSISDNGSGIPDNIREKIFNPFFTTKDVGKGTGMGLAIVMKIIEKHNGKIWFDTKVGGGTTFYMLFPITRS